jgi:hypothetical protein
MGRREGRPTWWKFGCEALWLGSKTDITGCAMDAFYFNIEVFAKTAVWYFNIK